MEAIVMEEITEITITDAETRAQASAFQIIKELEALNESVPGERIDSCGAFERFRQIFLRVLASKFAIVPG
jgi:hypothetical protein